MDTDQILEILQTVADDLGLAGLGYAVLADRAPLLTGGLGWADPAEKTAVTEDTRFPIASCTKAFTGLALSLLETSGILDMGRPVRDYIPEFRLHDEIASADITAEDLLCHRSGLPPHTWSWVYSEQGRRDFILERLPGLMPCCSYREQHQYSNIMYAVAGQLVEALTGSNWEDYTQAHLLDPLHMIQTKFLDAHWAQTPCLAMPHKREGIAWEKLAPFYARARHPIAPASEMLSTPRDMMVWLTAHLEKLDPFLSARGFHKYCEPQMLITEERPHPTLGPLSYARGWRQELFRGRPHLWHTGGCTGYSAVASFLPGAGLAVCLLSNSHAATPALRALVYETYDAMLKEESPGWSALLVEAPFPSLQVIPSPAPDLQISLPPPPGRYSEPGYGMLEIAANGIAARFNACENARIETERGGPELVFPDYGARFPVMVHVPTPGQPILDIPFEPEVPPIRFHREA